jgi:glycosyltransferase involved in cell wall biosynthesis
MLQQTMKPTLWLLIDDGSTDGSTECFRRELENGSIPFTIQRMPRKRKPNANRKGVAFQRSDILNEQKPEPDEYDYLVKVDADTRLPPYFVEFCSWVLDRFPSIGVLAGCLCGEVGGTTTMGTGKFVRWAIVRQTSGKFWDLDPDSLWNIKSARLGYRNVIIQDLKIEVTRATQVSGQRGSYNYGRRMYYVGRNPVLVINHAISTLGSKASTLEFVRGYLHELSRGLWKTDDRDVKYYYGLIREILRQLGMLPDEELTVTVSVGLENADGKRLTKEQLDRIYFVIKDAL